MKQHRRCIICDPTVGKIMFACFLAATGVFTFFVLTWFVIKIIIHFTMHLDNHGRVINV